MRRWFALFLGPFAALCLWLALRGAGWGVPTSGMAATTLLMSLWWVTSALPLAATALVPVIAFPLFEIDSMNGVASRYSNGMVMLFIGGFLIAGAVERWNLHRRVSLTLLAWLGPRPGRLVLAFMTASAGLSMWISNTATAVMMVAIGVALLDGLGISTEKPEDRALSLACMLGIAYGCSIGGIATLIGTPTNLVLLGVLRDAFPETGEISFGQWIVFGFPVAVGLFAVVWLVLTKLFYRRLADVDLTGAAAHSKATAIGPMSVAEKRVGIVFLVTGLLWIFRKDLELGALTLPGWTSVWEPLGRVNDGMIAIAMALLLFVLPAGGSEGSKRILDKDAFGKLPWSIVLLFGGGFALAGGFSTSGLADELASIFSRLEGASPTLVVGTACLGMTFLTEFSSNVASASIALPVLAAMSEGLGLEPLALLLPVTLCASMAFMMPVATPPNAVVFSSGRVTIWEMAKVGFFLNLLAVAWIFAATRILLPLVWG